jgi:DNA repair photolyase
VIKKGEPVKAVNISRLKKIINGDIPDDPFWIHFFSKRIPLHWGGMSEPSCYIEKEHKRGLELIRFLAEKNYPTIFSTKGTLFSEGEYYEIFKEAAKNKNFAFQFSIITSDVADAAQVEQNVQSPLDRIETMRKLSELGYWTILRLRPYIIGISSKTAVDLINRSAQAGANAISTEFYALESRTNEDMLKRYDVLSKICGFNITDYYKKLSPPERGGYLRLNRDVKEKYVKEMWMLCHKLGMQFNISDPDFKELNESGSCCGLPEMPLGENSQLTNYVKAQLSNLLRLARVKYWKEGTATISIQDLKDAEHPDHFYYDPKFYGYSVQCWFGEASKNMNHFKEFLNAWNNIGSPKNPYNYFHGKLKPFKKDAEGNIIFKYVPSDYEVRWKKEGIL